MNKWLALGFSLALTSLACGSSDSSDKGTDTNTTVGTGTGTTTSTGACVGANSNSLIGACTMMGQCFETYDKAAPIAAMTKAMGDACTGVGGTWVTTGCALPKVGCTCTETQNVNKTITYWDDAAYCSDCTGACKTLK
jgi:hypothetical protein